MSLSSGLERVAEELMGRRKWKHYQDQVTRNQFNIAEQQPISITQDTEEDSQKSEHYKPILNHRFEQPNSNSNNKNNQGLLQFERDFGKLREIMLDISSITFFSLSLSPCRQAANITGTRLKCNIT